MGEREHPEFMSGKLQLDPMFGPAPSEADAVSSPLLRPPDLAATLHPPAGADGPPAWLDPARMGSVFDHYGDDGGARELDDKLKLPSHLPGPEGKRTAPKRWGKNDAGAGVTVGDWQIGVAPKGKTSDRFDTVGTRARAEREEQDELAERYRREPR